MNENTIIKSALADSVQSGVPDDGDLELISRYTRKAPDRDSIYTFSVILCDNDIDRDCERFSVSSLHALCGMFTGVTGIFDHSMKSSDQTARIYRTAVMTDDSRITAAGEKYTYLKAWCYMLRTEKNADLIAEIDAGIKKEVSVSCSCEKRICSVCGNDMRSHGCIHSAGAEYDGVMCHAVLENPSDAYEWSFVAVPAQRNAGVSKSLRRRAAGKIAAAAVNPEDILKTAMEASSDVTLTRDQIKAFGRYIEEMKADAVTGRSTREAAEREIISLSAFTLPDADTSMLGGILRKISGEEVIMLRKALGERAEKLAVFSCALSSDKKKSFNDNSHFKI